MHQFTIPGPPVPWKRARRRGNTYYIDRESAAYRLRVICAAKNARAPRLDGPVAVSIKAYWPCRKRDERVRTPYPGGWMTSPKDADNVAKGIMDALNGVAYVDDGQVAVLRVEKRWAAQGEAARVVVSYGKLGEA